MRERSFALFLPAASTQSSLNHAVYLGRGVGREANTPSGG